LERVVKEITRSEPQYLAVIQKNTKGPLARWRPIDYVSTSGPRETEIKFKERTFRTAFINPTIEAFEELRRLKRISNFSFIKISSPDEVIIGW